MLPTSLFFYRSTSPSFPWRPAQPITWPASLRSCLPGDTRSLRPTARAATSIDTIDHSFFRFRKINDLTECRCFAGDNMFSTFTVGNGVACSFYAAARNTWSRQNWLQRNLCTIFCYQIQYVRGFVNKFNIFHLKHLL